MAPVCKQDIQTRYHAIANKYDALTKLYLLIGFLEKSYRKQAVSQLQLTLGDTVVELGCGTGMNFSLLNKFVGPNGKIVGIDYSESMLSEARKKIHANGWRNVDLVHCDAADYEFQQPVDGIVSTFALVFMPDYERIIRLAGKGVKPGKRFVVLD